MEIDDLYHNRVIVNSTISIEYENTPRFSSHDYSRVTIGLWDSDSGTSKYTRAVTAYRGVICENQLGFRDRAMVMIAKIFGDLFMGNIDPYAMIVDNQKLARYDVQYPGEYVQLLMLCSYIRVGCAAKAIDANAKAIDDIDTGTNLSAVCSLPHQTTI